MNFKNILALALLASFALGLGCVGGETKVTGTTPLDAFNASINRFVGLANGTGDFSETVVMGISNRTSLVNVSRHGADYSVYLGSDINAWTLVSKSGADYLCLRFRNETECTNDTGLLESTSSGIAQSLQSVLFTSDYAKRVGIKYNSLLRHGSFSVINYANDSGMRSFEVNYSLKDLTGAELSQLYLSPTSPEMGVASFTETMIFRESDGMKVLDNLDYEYAGKSYHETNNVTSFSQSSGTISAPAQANDTMFKALFYSFAQFWTDYSNVSSESKLMELIIQYHMPELCRSSSNFSDCIDAYTAIAKDANACPLLSGDEQDKCWYYFGTYVNGGNATYCASIADETLKAECLNATAPANATVQNTTGNSTALQEAVAGSTYILYRGDSVMFNGSKVTYYMMRSRLYKFMVEEAGTNQSFFAYDTQPAAFGSRCIQVLESGSGISMASTDWVNVSFSQMNETMCSTYCASIADETLKAECLNQTVAANATVPVANGTSNGTIGS